MPANFLFCILLTCFLFYDFLLKIASEEINSVSSQHVKIDTVTVTPSEDTQDEHEWAVSCQSECYGETNVIFYNSF